MKAIPIIQTSILIVLLYSSIPFGQSEKASRLHTPDEIFKIMEESELSYVFGEDTISAREDDSPTVLINQFFLRDSSGKTTLDKYDFPKYALLLVQGDKEFANKNFDGALKYYHQLYATQPEYSFALTMIGDAFYSRGDIDSAIIYFRRAIDMNFIDYSAHWFLADSYDKIGLFDSALKEITIAHLLNVNHAVLKSKFKEYRESANRPWQEWDFKPHYHLSKDGYRVLINTSPEWVGYAMVKAVWKYEPDYAKKVDSAEPDSLLVNWSEEKEAVTALLADSTKNLRIREIITDGYFIEFILYELAGKKWPTVLLILPRDQFRRIYEYVEKYH